MRKLPAKITQRSATMLVAEALCRMKFAAAIGRRAQLELEPQERAAFEAMLRITPRVGGPGVHFGVPLVDARALAEWEPPVVPMTHVRLARPADHAGAVYDENGEPVGPASRRPQCGRLRARLRRPFVACRDA